ncbi:MAG: hypothetical protein JNK19_11045 [Tabrizicola sp.]|nr:hypothetical protein [Tabrizicola sp.]
MRILEQSTDRLALRVIPFRAFLLLGAITLLFFAWAAALINAGQAKGGFALFGIGVLFFFGCFGVFVKVLWVTLDRRQNLAEVVEGGIFGKKRKSFTLGDIHGATLQSMVIKRRAGDLAAERRSYRKRTPEPRVWRVAFARGNNAPLPLTEVYGSEKSARAVGGAINAWFGSPGQE